MKLELNYRNVFRYTIYDIRYTKKASVLLISLIFMIGLVGFTLAYVSLVTYGTRNVGGQENNLRSFYLAESGMNKAIYYLLKTAPDGTTDGSWRTTAYPADPGANATDPQQELLGSGTYTIWVETSGDDILITSMGSVNGIERTVQKIVSYSGGGESVPESFTYVSYAGGNVDFSDSKGTAQVNGDIGAQGSVEEGGVPVSGGIDENSNVVIPSVDYAEYENIADNIVNGDKIFAQNSTSMGIWYVKGNVEIASGATINGTIVAEGNISFTQNNGTVTAVASYPALVAQGDIESNGWNNLTITGAVLAEGNFIFNDSNNFTFSGSLVVGGDLEITNANNFNIIFNSVNPPFITGGEVPTGDASVVSVSGSWKEI